MTKATRWGVTALMMIGGLSLGAFAGCSDDDPPAQQPEEDTGILDTAPKDTGSPDTTATDTADAADTAPFKADRAATLVFGSPDLGGKFVCFGAFLDDPATKDAPLQTLPATGAVGVPDMTAPEDFTKTAAFPYGAVVPVPLPEAAVIALKTFNFVVYLVDENPAKMMPAKTCSTVWKDIKADTWRWKSFPKDTINAGEHGFVAMQGCRTPGAGCGTEGFDIKLHKFSLTAKPTESGANVGIQFLHLSQFGGFTLPLEAGTVSVPGFQSADVYLVPGAAAGGGDAGADAAEAGDAAPPAPTFIKIAENVKFNDVPNALKGFTLPAGVKNDLSRIVIATRVPTDGGATSFPCANPIEMGKAGSAPSTSCPNWTFYLKPFFDGGKYGSPPISAGLEYPNTNQLFIIAGSPVPEAMPTLRIMAARTATWMP